METEYIFKPKDAVVVKGKELLYNGAFIINSIFQNSTDKKYYAQLYRKNKYVMDADISTLRISNKWEYLISLTPLEAVFYIYHRMRDIVKPNNFDWLLELQDTLAIQKEKD